VAQPGGLMLGFALHLVVVVDPMFFICNDLVCDNIGSKGVFAAVERASAAGTELPALPHRRSATEI